MQVALEVEIVPVCDTYKLFNRRRGGLTQLVKDLSQLWYVVRSAISKRGVETKKVLRAMCTAEEERFWLAWKSY